MKIVAAVSIAFVMMVGVTGCGSDDDVQVESRVKNAAPEASGVSDGPSEADCDRLDRLALSYLITRLDRDILDLSDLRNLSDRDLLDLLEGRNFLELYDSCTDALISGNYAPEGDDVDGG